MSAYLQLDDAAPETLASTQGMADLRAWATRVEEPEVLHFLEYGWSDEVEVLAHELEQAMEKAPPTASVKSTLDSLVSQLHGGVTIAAITNGVS